MPITDLFIRLTRIGISKNLTAQDGRRIYIINLIAIVAIFVGSLNLFATVWFTFDHFGYWVITPSVFLLVYFFIPYFNHRGWHTFAGVSLVLTSCGAIVSLSTFVGRDFGVHLYFMLVATLPFLFFSQLKPHEKHLPLVFLVLSIIFFLYVELFLNFRPPMENYDPLIGKFIFTLNIVLTFIELFVFISQFHKDTLRVNVLLEKEFQRSNELLLNILPEAVANKLKNNDTVSAEEYADISVLFADIVDFTPLSSSFTAAKLVDLLNDIFSRFDHITEKYQLEKIKTIGDAYMLAGGLNQDEDDHLEKIIMASLDMREAFYQFSEENSVNLKLRIGIHAGTAVAGVIGLKKFSYDIWGNTVNMASYLESNGLPNEIQISSSVYQRICDKFHCINRGQLNLKDGGQVMTYLVKEAKR